ncbi:MAG: rhomboid family intramembrane serine protease [Ectothiorhodospiraceae bacterium]|nr:rhomboid family intramembrane serine protease [Ectothiorhodospiraceae bacterium]
MPRSKRCPHCTHQTLQVNYYHGEEVDVCRQCGGLWFEKGNLDAIIAAKDARVEQADFTDNLGQVLGPCDRHCPDCARPLQTCHLLPDYHLDVDVCLQCDGAWVERESVSQVSKSSAIKHALESMNGGVSWKTWVFQFLLRLPVEYNVKPRSTPWVTWTLIALNTLIFLLYAFDTRTFNAVITHFALSPAAIQAGDAYWTFLTAVFLHGSLLHLAGNMYFLWVVGANLEDALGKLRFLGLYLFCGVAAGVVSVLANLGSTIPSVGASGAIAGLFGMYALWFPNASLTFMFFVYQKKLAVYWYFAIWLALNLFGMLAGGQGVDYWAHIGGFVVGLALGAALRRRVWAANPLLAHLAGPEVQLRR